ncbi:uncharacterized protein DUF1657 [Bacillus oleivorans]|uniref:Uncharacterized protein DUF1657 n=1 Tax=Bacillus oleivorans TaxID=1448271 RepID=A0A285CNK3_9BACI|nr:DUF1657 domain-containing protein [Bacillus oleivorans]SNX68563.1 uncharacterized protein DUF1657 [Bacillus oleivorans]
MTIASNVKQCIATISGIEAQLSTLALNSRDPNAAKIFHESMLVVEEVKKDLNQRLMKIENQEPQYRGS